MTEEENQYIEEKMNEIYQVEDALSYYDESESETLENIEYIIEAETIEECLKRYEEQKEKEEAFIVEDIDQFDTLFNLKIALIDAAYDNMMITLDEFDEFED